ncbi:integrin alpha-9-like isoform X1 [Acipenser oxyrinchus oxyrinchus]|uniref:Integrin alpha-9-like isoform X1 n=1 Tax=Acipenser oxyrinchus oxyrinchus TaxID=40147 RepID=A0AAD8LQ95_ACIOX|nr:integrin alpha-9-like isoform X1 [Acipenser oxyrinchus oxyrinchus]
MNNFKMAGMVTKGRRGVLKVFVALFSVSLVYSYNIDLDHPVVYQGPKGTFFGYSVLEHYHDNTRWVIVGAPKANSTFSVSVSSPGAIFKCRVHSNPEKRCTEMDMGRGNERSSSCGKTCRGDRENEWMGVSLARQDRANGSVLACAHRWKNVFYGSEHILPHGFCSIIPPNLQRNGRDLIPCYEEYKKKYGEEHGSCQAGIAGFFTEELVVMGAPGSYYWTGTVKVLNLTDNTSYKLRDGSIGASRYSYLGYAVTAGHFSQPTATDVVGGAPQDGGVGKVYIFKTERGSLVKIFQASGKKMGSYFGSSLCAVDLNQDGLSDLLVGAPMFSEIRDEGHVAVFINKGNGVLEERVLLNGDNAYNAHFGESIAMLGDLDDDGFPDVAIGAPKEEDFAGAVYIYHGDAQGIVATYSMRLSGQNINPALRMFGQSISGNVDMDGNGYPDVTIGAFMSDNVVLLRTRPVITVDILIFLPVSINITAPQCHDGSQHLNCLNVSACLRFRGKQVPGQIGLVYNLTADVTKREKGQQSRVVFALNGELTSHVNEQIQLSYNEEKCRHYMAYVRKEVKDVFSPIIFEAAYSLVEHVIDSKDDKELPALKPVLRWKKGGKIAQRNQTVFERNCLSDDCAADLRLRGWLLLPGMDPKPYLALGSVKNISVNVSISNAGDDAYDTNVYFNFSRELYFIKMWQKEEKGISCELLELDFLKCSVGFPFMRAQSKYHLGVIFDTSHLSGDEENLQFLVSTQSANPEHEDTLSDNILHLSVPLIHEVDTTITGVVSPTSFVYGDSVDAARFVQMDNMQCFFQPLNYTFQVINNGPSRLPGSTVHILLPNRLGSSGAEMLHVQETVVGQEKGNCTYHRNPTPCTIPQDRESIFHTIFAFFTKSGRKVVDCERPGRSCLIITCLLSSLAKEESRSIDVRILLNTEILKKDTSSVIQFVTRGSVMVDTSLRAVEVSNGLSEHTTVVFEALHNMEPRGYVVGWIIAISLLVGILIFLLLAVLLWKIGFFRRRYKEIIEAEKNRKDSDESWDWVQKSQ